jgi:NAD(P)-dependent dehydrogenase (short-subunit alcohol dehydrogenase family)
VFAGCRNPESAHALSKLKEKAPERLTILPLDVTDSRSIEEAESFVRRDTDSLDLLINNAGIYMAPHALEYSGQQPTERPGSFSFDDALLVIKVNAVAPLIIAQQFLELLKRGHNPRIVSISSGYGSVSSNTGGFPYYYSASKAALNMYMRSLAADLAKHGITTALVDPGWVQTDMGGPQATFSPEASVREIIRVVVGLKPKDTGRFLNREGHDEAW